MSPSTPNNTTSNELAAENDKQTLIRKLIDGIKQYDAPQVKTNASDASVKETR